MRSVTSERGMTRENSWSWPAAGAVPPMRGLYVASWGSTVRGASHSDSAIRLWRGNKRPSNDRVANLLRPTVRRRRAK